MFICHVAHNVLILLIYVDDILVIGNNLAQVSSFITRPNSSFSLHDLDYVNYFLGIEIVRHGTMFHISKHNICIRPLNLHCHFRLQAYYYLGTTKTNVVSSWWWTSLGCYLISKQSWCTSIPYHTRHFICH